MKAYEFLDSLYSRGKNVSPVKAFSVRDFSDGYDQLVLNIFKSAKDHVLSTYRGAYRSLSSPIIRGIYLEETLAVCDGPFRECGLNPYEKFLLSDALFYQTRGNFSALSRRGTRRPYGSSADEAVLVNAFIGTLSEFPFKIREIPGSLKAFLIHDFALDYVQDESNLYRGEEIPGMIDFIFNRLKWGE